MPRHGSSANGERPGLLAIGLLALHVADDNFLQPQPGTSAADHLVSGLVPLALLAGLLARYGHFKAGLRATIAIALGLFGIVAGLGEAGTTPSRSGRRATTTPDCSRFLQGCCSWASASRPSGGRGGETTDRRGGTHAAPAGGCRPRRRVPRARPAGADVRLHACCARCRSRGRAGYGLRAGVLHDERRPDAARLVRAFAQRRCRDLGSRASGLTEARAHVGATRLRRLLFDRRGEGESDGDPNIFGWGAERDFNAAVAYLRTRGTSITGASAVLAFRSEARRYSRPRRNRTASRRSSPTVPARDPSRRTSPGRARRSGKRSRPRS